MPLFREDFHGRTQQIWSLGHGDLVDNMKPISLSATEIKTIPERDYLRRV